MYLDKAHQTSDRIDDLAPPAVEVVRERWARAQDALADGGIDTVISASPPTVQWLTGWYDDPERLTWSSRVPPIAILHASQGHLIMGVPSTHQERTLPDVQLWFTTTRRMPSGDGDVVAVLRRLLTALRPRRLGVELDHWPAAWMPVLTPYALADASQVFRQLRSTKDRFEVAVLRLAAQVADVGHTTFRRFARPGITELDLWSIVQSVMDSVVGVRVPTAIDLISGDRISLVAGPPTTRTLNEGDAVLLDLAPRVHGYWADTCLTISVTNPSQHFRHMYAVVRDALDMAASALRPGMAARELDTLVRDAITRRGYGLPHHVGHGVGIDYFEYPLILPASSDVIPERAVVCLEPAAFDETGGVRLEKMFLVETDGARPLTFFDETLTV